VPMAAPTVAPTVALMAAPTVVPTAARTVRPDLHPHRSGPGGHA
jgi:hypothetical protein